MYGFMSVASLKSVTHWSCGYLVVCLVSCFLQPVCLAKSFTVKEISHDQFGAICSQISGGNVVWRGHDENAHPQIFFWDGLNAIPLTDYYVANCPHISGNNVIWLKEDDDARATELIFWDGTTTTHVNENDNDFGVSPRPQISGSNVVWRGIVSIEPNADILLWNGTTTTLISNEFTADDLPRAWPDGL